MAKKKKEPEGPPCPTCNTPQVEKILTIINAPCWSCGADMKVSYIRAEPMSMLRGHTSVPPSEFTEEEIAFASEKGVVLKEQRSNTMQKTYVANSCKACGTFCGDFYLFQDYIVPAYDGVFPSESFNLGLACPTCEDPPYPEEEDCDILPG